MEIVRRYRFHHLKRRTYTYIKELPRFSFRYGERSGEAHKFLYMSLLEVVEGGKTSLFEVALFLHELDV